MTLEVFPLWMLYRDFEVPVGTVVMWPAIESLGSSDSKIPEGWKICNGQQLNRSDYQDLWNTIRLTYTVGDDSNTFNIPDLTNTFVRGTNPDYNSSTGRYSWSSNKLPGLKQSEEFKHSMINVTVTPELNIESYETPVSFQVKTESEEKHSHDDAVPDGYRYTTIDNAEPTVAGHDFSELDADHAMYVSQGGRPWEGGDPYGRAYTTRAVHILNDRSRYGSGAGYQQADYPLGSFYGWNGGARHDARKFRYQYMKEWYHKHEETIHESSSASRGIVCYNEAGTWNNQNSEFDVGQTSIAWNQADRNVLSQGQLNSAGHNIQDRSNEGNRPVGQLLGQPSIGSHRHVFNYSIDRTHSHLIEGQTGTIEFDGLDEKIEPKHIPMIYIIYTGVI